MAVTYISKTLFSEVEIFDMVHDFFDKMTLIRDEPWNERLVYWVEGEEIPENANEIDLTVYNIRGVKPFIYIVNVISYLPHKSTS